jgi:hypothetical protein
MADEVNTKRCRLCKITKPLPAYRKTGRTPDGRRGNCRECEQPLIRQRLATRHERAARENERKTCRECLVNKPGTEFYPRVRGDGLQHRCIACFALHRELVEKHGIGHDVKRLAYLGDDRLNTINLRIHGLRMVRRIEMLERQSHDDTTGQASPPDEDVWAAYIASPGWKKLRQCVIEERGARCERCGSAEELQLHHTSYRRLGNEAPEDLLLLCEICHHREHGASENIRSGYVSVGVPISARQWGKRDGVETTAQRNISVAEYEQEKAKEIA